MSKMKESFFFFDKVFHFVLGILFIFEGLVLVFTLGTVRLHISTDAISWYLLKSFDYVEYKE